MFVLFLLGTFLLIILSIILYYILTNKNYSRIFSKIVLVFTISCIIKWGVSYILVVNWNNLSEIMVYIHSLFMVSFCTISEAKGLFNTLPTLFDLYNNIKHHGVKGFIALLFKEKLEKQGLLLGPLYMEGGESSATGARQGGSGSGSGSGSGAGYGSGSASGMGSGPNSLNPELSDHEYWKLQLLMYQEALKHFDKPNDQLTPDQLYYRNQVKIMDEFNKDKIKHAISLLERNANFPSDAESLRMEKVRLNLDRDAEMRTESYLKFLREQALLASAKSKLENLADFNRRNHQNIGLSGVDKLDDNRLKNLTADELRCVVKVITTNPNVPEEVKQRIKLGHIVGRIGVNNPIIRYLDSIINKP